MRDAPEKQWSKGKQAIQAQLEKGSRVQLDLNQMVGDWAVKLYLTKSYKQMYISRTGAA